MAAQIATTVSDGYRTALVREQIAELQAQRRTLAEEAQSGIEAAKHPNESTYKTIGGVGGAVVVGALAVTLLAGRSNGLGKGIGTFYDGLATLPRFIGGAVIGGIAGNRAGLLLNRLTDAEDTAAQDRIRRDLVQQTREIDSRIDNMTLKLDASGDPR